MTSVYPAKSPFIIPVHWNPPPPGWLKINIDGAAKGSPGHAGCDGIFRTCRGFVKSTFSIYLGIKFVFEAELTGLILAIEIASKLNWNNLWVESDPEYAVYSLKHRSHNVPWPLRNRWLNSLLLADKMNVKISHIF